MPTSPLAAFEQDETHALAKRRRNVECLAEQMGITPALLYKHLETGSMRTTRLIAWEHLTGSDAVVRYLGAVRNAAPPAQSRVYRRTPRGFIVSRLNLCQVDTIRYVSQTVAQTCPAILFPHDKEDRGSPLRGGARFRGRSSHARTR